MATGRGGGAAKIGNVFLRAATGPLQYASSLITSNNISKGLDELAPASLGEAFERAVGDVAAMVGIPTAEVERILPGPEIAGALQRVAASHAAAVAAWRLHAGQTGFLDVITALTQDGRQPDITMCLERVAGKLRADPELAAPLDSLAVDVAAWSDLVVRCRHILEDRRWLADAYRRRLLLRGVLFAVPLGALIAFTVTVVYVRIRRDAIDARLAASDPCAIEALTEHEAKIASGAQVEAVATKRAACDAIREEEAQRRREEERRAEEERRLKAAREARERACAALADAVDAGALDDATSAAADGDPAIVDRLARKALDPADIGPGDPKLPCGDTPAGRRLEGALANALLADVSLWTQRADPGPLVRAMLIARKDELPANALLGLADNAERTAKAGLTGGDPDTIARAKRRCSLARDLGVPGRGSCTAVEGL